MDIREPAVTRKELACTISSKCKVDNDISKKVVDKFFDIIVNTLIEGEEVKISCFGTFSVVTKVARPGRNPKTGEFKEITERNVVRFSPSKKLRNRSQL